MPVYDYALMTEPLSADQLDAIGWSNRQGLGDSSNQFHYYRLSRDNRILFGGYDAIYHYGGRIREEYENRPADLPDPRQPLLHDLPAARGPALQPQVGRTHRHLQPVLRLLRRGPRRPHRLRDRLHRASASRPTHFGAKVMLDLLAGRTTERTELEMVKSRPLPFPPEPVASIGIQATRWSLDRADHNRGERNLILKTLDAVGLGFDS